MSRKVRFACNDCKKRCKSDCLRCGVCKSRVHASCQKISSELFRKWEDIPKDFICRTCVTTDGEQFDYLKGITRLTEASKLGLNKLRSVVMRESLILKDRYMSLDPYTPAGLQIDDVADMLYSRYTFDHTGRAARVSSDGNCLFNALSMILIGNETLSIELRYKTCLEMVINSGVILAHPSHASFRLLSPDFNEACRQCARIGKFSSIWTIIALTNVVGISIKVLYPAVNGCKDLAFVKLNKTFKPEIMQRGGDGFIKIMWTSICKPKSGAIWIPNHFVPIVPRSSAAQSSTPISQPQSGSKPPILESTQLEGVQQPQRDTQSVSKSQQPAMKNMPTNTPETQTGVKFDTESAAPRKRLKFTTCVPIGKLSTTSELSHGDISTQEQPIPLINVRHPNRTPQSTSTPQKHQIEFRPTINSHEPQSRSDKEYKTKSEALKKQRKFPRCMAISPIMPELSPGDISSPEHEEQQIPNASQPSIDADMSGDCNYSGMRLNRSSSSEHVCDSSEESAKDMSDSSYVLQETVSGRLSTSEECEKTCKHSINSDKKTEAVVTSRYTGKSGSLENQQFLEMDAVLNLLKLTCQPEPNIPEGRKDNVYYVVDNKRNLDRRAKNLKSEFSDDRGVWAGAKGATPKTIYVIDDDGGMKKVWLKQGLYCLEKSVSKVRQYVPFDPQPTKDHILEICRNYSYLKADNDYRRRITWIEHAPFSFGSIQQNIVVEYKGTFKCWSAHGNSKRGKLYVRTPGTVMEEVGEVIQRERPKNAYDIIIGKHSDTTAPPNPRQMRDKKYQDKKKRIQAEEGVYGHRKNLADNYQIIQNWVYDKHPLVKTVSYTEGSVPCIILYTDEMIRDLKNICCSGKAILGFDKTFNLSQEFVTASVYKQISVESVERGGPPIFLGPMLIHGESTFQTYGAFFSHLSLKLADTNTERLVIGTDDEAALKKAIMHCFPKATHVLCTRHLIKNAEQKLKDIGVSKNDRKSIIDMIFGNDSAASADETVVFEDRCSKITSYCELKAPDFINYFNRNLRKNVFEKIVQPVRVKSIEKNWTNNNCESINHVLKGMVDWKSQSVVDLIKKLEILVQANYKDLRRAIINTGQFRLADNYSMFSISRDVWINKTEDEKVKHYNRFRNYQPKDSRMVKSTDGRTTVPITPSMGKKPGQRKRKPNERARSVKKLKP